MHDCINDFLSDYQSIAQYALSGSPHFFCNTQAGMVVYCNDDFSVIIPSVSMLVFAIKAFS